MKVDLHFDDDAFRRIAQEAVDKVAVEQTRDLERLRQQYVGKSVEQIKPALQRLFASYDGKITEPELSEWAQLISEGTKITMKSDKVRW